jgi:hypothetical protein
MAKHWIAGAIKHKGALHRQLGVPEGQKIPAAKIESASHSSNPTLAKRANLAKTLKGFDGIIQREKSELAAHQAKIPKFGK